MPKQNKKKKVRRRDGLSGLENIMHKIAQEKPSFDLVYNPLAILITGNASLLYGTSEVVEKADLQGASAYLVYTASLGLGYLLNRYVFWPLAKKEYKKNGEKILQNRPSGKSSWIKNLGLTAALLFSLLGVKKNYSHHLEDRLRYQPVPQHQVVEPAKEAKQEINTTGYVRARELYLDLKKEIPNDNLVQAIVANAWGESMMNPRAVGDCGDYGKKNNGIVVDGEKCCSYGLWQTNICRRSGLGHAFIRDSGYDSIGDQGKLDLLLDYGSQMEFMVRYLIENYPREISKDKSAEEWVEWFVYNIERPKDQPGETVKRQAYFNKLAKKGVFNQKILE